MACILSFAYSSGFKYFHDIDAVQEYKRLRSKILEEETFATEALRDRFCGIDRKFIRLAQDWRTYNSEEKLALCEQCLADLTDFEKERYRQANDRTHSDRVAWEKYKSKLKEVDNYITRNRSTLFEAMQGSGNTTDEYVNPLYDLKMYFSAENVQSLDALLNKAKDVVAAAKKSDYNHRQVIKEADESISQIDKEIAEEDRRREKQRSAEQRKHADDLAAIRSRSHRNPPARTAREPDRTQPRFAASHLRSDDRNHILEPVRDPKSWACSSCTFLNPRSRTNCKMCAQSRNAPVRQQQETLLTPAVQRPPNNSRQDPPAPRRSNSDVLPRETTIPRSRDGTPARKNAGDWWKHLSNEARKFCSKHCLLMVAAALFCLFGVSEAMSPSQQGDQSHRGTGTSSDASWYTNPWTWMACAALGYASTYFCDQKQLPSAQSMPAPGLRPVKPEHAIGAKPRSEDTSDTKSQWIWIIVVIAVLLAVGGGAAAFFFCKSSPSYGEEDHDLEQGRRRHRYHRRRRE